MGAAVPIITAALSTGTQLYQAREQRKTAAKARKDAASEAGRLILLRLGLMPVERISDYALIRNQNNLLYLIRQQHKNWGSLCFAIQVSRKTKVKSPLQKKTGS